MKKVVFAAIFIFFVVISANIDLITLSVSKSLIIGAQEAADDGMSPTIKNGEFFNIFKLPFIKLIRPQKGDIVIARILKNGGDHDFINRIIATPGDKVVFKEGFVYLNGQLLDESYTLKPRSTWIYNQALLGKNCEEITIPPDKFLMLPDNREAGGYSLYGGGLLSYNDVIGYIPKNLVRFYRYWPITKILENRERDTSHDKDLIGTSTLDSSAYIQLINQERQKIKLNPLMDEANAVKISDLVLQDMIDKKYYSYDSQKIDPVIQNALTDLKYNVKNAIYWVDTGFYDATSFFNSEMDNGRKSYLLNRDYSSIGVSSKVVNINGCPQQVNVQVVFQK